MIQMTGDPPETPAEGPDEQSQAEPDDHVRAVAPAIEAMLFAAEEPLSLEDLRQALPKEDREEAAAAVECLEARYREDGHGVQVTRVAGGYRITTRAEFDRHLRALYRRRHRFRPGRAALETLAIIAYRQPITAPEISEIRGVDPSGVVHTLLEKRMIRTRGRRKVVGKPFLYGTTTEFLVHFGLDSLDELPSMEEFSAMIGDWPEPDEGTPDPEERTEASADSSEVPAAITAVEVEEDGAAEEEEEE